MNSMGRLGVPNDSFSFLITSKLRTMQAGLGMPCLLGMLANIAVSLTLESFTLPPEEKTLMGL